MQFGVIFDEQHRIFAMVHFVRSYLGVSKWVSEWTNEQFVDSSRL